MSPAQALRANSIHKSLSPNRDNNRLRFVPNGSPVQTEAALDARSDSDAADSVALNSEETASLSDSAVDAESAPTPPDEATEEEVAALAAKAEEDTGVDIAPEQNG